ncbi:MAG: NADP-dependent malic enzyme [Candidatus Micrarchaeota archaeon]
MAHDSESLELHKKLRGKLKISGKASIKDQKDLSLLYTPGVADACREIAKDKSLAYELTMKWNSVAIVTDGTRVLGLGNIGPEAAMPVMEGKALIMQQFSGIDAIPICLAARDEDEIVRIVKALEPGFGAINLEDIETPKVFSIERRLTEELEIPVFHDDQHGTAIVALAALHNALRASGKGRPAKIGIIGAGSAGYAIAKLLHAADFSDLVVFDSKGAICPGRPGIEEYKKTLAALNKSGFRGGISDFKGADVIISAASPGSLPDETVLSMKGPKIVFALSNPVPEISMEKAKELGIAYFGTGRSDCPNQINNSLCFPGFLRALLDLRVKKITDGMKIAAAEAIAGCVSEAELEAGKIVPEVFDKRVVPAIVENVKKSLG